MKTSVISAALLILVHLYTFAAEDLLIKDYIVQKGDSLSSIAKVHSVNLQILRKLNQIHNPSNVLAGSKLRIPISPAYFIAPYLEMNEEFVGDIQVGRLNKTDVIVGLYTRNIRDDFGGIRFRVLKIEGTDIVLVFDSFKFSYSYGRYDIPNSSVMDWKFIDLDNDGSTDITAERIEGTAVFITVYGFHYDGRTYHQYLIVDGISIGNIQYRRVNKNIDVEITHRYSTQKTVVNWKSIKESKPLQ